MYVRVCMYVYTVCMCMYVCMGSTTIGRNNLVAEHLVVIHMVVLQDGRIKLNIDRIA